MIIPNPVKIAEERFKAASAEAALFELQIRLCAGTIPATCDAAIDTQVSHLRPAILEHYKSMMVEADVKLLEKACTLRNKLLHCEFSAARRHLDERNPKVRAGGIMKFSVTENTQLSDLVDRFKTGEGDLVADTKTKKLSDTFGWLLECASAGEFDEAANIFREAYALLERVAERAAAES